MTPSVLSGESVKHTPGPWVLVTAEGRDDSDTFFVMAQPHPAMRGFTKDIAMVEGDANAKLIAAAPDLLDICIRQREELRLIRMKDCAAVYDTTVRIGADIAIAKAGA